MPSVIPVITIYLDITLRTEHSDISVISVMTEITEIGAPMVLINFIIFKSSI